MSYSSFLFLLIFVQAAVSSGRRRRRRCRSSHARQAGFQHRASLSNVNVSRNKRYLRSLISSNRSNSNRVIGARHSNRRRPQGRAQRGLQGGRLTRYLRQEDARIRHYLMRIQIRLLRSERSARGSMKRARNSIQSGRHNMTLQGTRHSRRRRRQGASSSITIRGQSVISRLSNISHVPISRVMSSSNNRNSRSNQCNYNSRNSNSHISRYHHRQIINSLCGRILMRLR